nr:unnamed protein product [Callosobruchus analis]
MLVSYLYVSTLMISTDIGSIVMKRWFEISFSSLTILLGKVITTLLIGRVFTFYNVFYCFSYLACSSLYTVCLRKTVSNSCGQSL